MKVLSRARAAYALSLLLSALLLVALALPAAAAKPAGKGSKAKAHRAETTAVTEDNDTNDGDTPNNVVDDGDNRHPSGKDKSVEHGGSGNQGKSQSDPDGDSNGGLDKPDGPGGVDLADQDGNNGCGNDDDFEDDNNGNCGPKVKPAPVEEPVTEPEAPSTDEEPVEGGCTEGSTECTPDQEPSCTEGSDECTPDLGGAEGDCGGTHAGCTTDDTTDGDNVVGSETGSPALVDQATGDVLGIEGQLEGETDVAGVSIERAPSRVLGAVDVAAGEAAAVATGPDALAATGAPLVVLVLLALGGLGVGTGLVRRSKR